MEFSRENRDWPGFVRLILYAASSRRFNEGRVNLRHISTRFDLGSGLEPGRWIGEYQIVSALAQGGMGAVFEVCHRSGQSYALKTLLTTQPNDELIQRFQREYSILTQIDHPNIVRVRDAGQSPYGPYLVFDLIRGETLLSHVRSAQRRGGLSLQEALEIISSLAGALVDIHSLGLIHRDIKPANVLIEASSGNPILIDFGLAGQCDEAEKLSGFSQSLTQTGQLLGTPGFMAPEQLDPASFGAMTTACDIWALGALLSYTLTAAGPYGEGSAVEQQAAALTREPPRLNTLRSDVPPNLAALHQSMLARDPAERPDAETLSEAFATIDLRVRRRPHGLLALLFLIAGGFLLHSIKPAPQPELTLFSWPRFTANPDLEVQAQVTDAPPGATLFVNAERISLEKDGRFSIKQSLSEGPNSFRIEVKSAEGLTLLEELHASILDRSGFALGLFGYPRITVESSLKIRGQIFSKKPFYGATAQIHELVSPIDPEGRFEVDFPLVIGENVAELIVRNRVGAESRQKIQVHRRELTTIGPERPLGEQLRALKPGWIRLKPGNYSLDWTITAGDWTIEGAAIDQVVIESAGPYIALQQGGSLTLRSLTLRGPQGLTAKSDKSTAIRCEIGQTQIENCRIERFSDGIIAYGKTAKVTVSNTLFRDIVLTGVGALNASSVQIDDCQFDEIRSAAAALDRSSLSLRDCKISRIREIGIYSREKASISIQKCKMDGGSIAVNSHDSNLSVQGLEVEKVQHIAVRCENAPSALKIRNLTTRGCPSGLLAIGQPLDATNVSISDADYGLQLAGGRIQLKTLDIKNCANHAVVVTRMAQCEASEVNIANCKSGFSLTESSKLKLGKSEMSGLYWAGVITVTGSTATVEDLYVHDSATALAAKDGTTITAKRCRFENMSGEGTTQEGSGRVSLLEK